MWTYEDDSEEGNSNSDSVNFGRLSERVLQTRALIVSEVVTDKLYKRIATMMTLFEQEDSEAPVTVYVNSPGGSADSGFAIYDLLRFSPCPIHTVANGIVASSAVLIYLAGEDKKRFSLPHSRFLLHQPSSATRGQASDIEITAREIVKLRDRYNKIVERHTGRAHAKVLEDADRDFWLSASESKEYGLVNKIVEKKSELA